MLFANGGGEGGGGLRPPQQPRLCNGHPCLPLSLFLIISLLSMLPTPTATIFCVRPSKLAEVI